jgi:hypothetical protein
MDVRAVYPDYLDAVTEGDRRRALRVIGDARAAGFDLRVLYLECFSLRCGRSDASGRRTS